MKKATCRIYAILWLTLLCVPISCSGLRSKPYRPGIPSHAVETLKQVQETYLADRSMKCAEQLERLVHDYPDFVEAHRYLQNLYLSENRHGYLRNRYQNRLKARPQSPVSHYLFGRLLTEPGRQVDAFNKAVSLDPAFFWGYNGLGFAYRNQRDFSESEHAYREAIQSAPNRAEPFIGLTSLYLAREDFKSAGKILDRGLKRFPHNLSLLLLHYQHLAGTKDPAAALEAMVELELPDNMSADFFNFMLKLMTVDSSEALVRKILYRFGPAASGPIDYQGALDLVLGTCCMRLGDLNNAMTHFKRVLQIDPANARARRALRTLYAQNLKLREAWALHVADCPVSWIEGSPMESVYAKLSDLEDRLTSDCDLQAQNKAVFELGDTLRGLGWLDAAAFHLGRIVGEESEWGRKAGEALDEIYRHNRFELALKDFFFEQYRAFKAQGRGMDLEDAREKLKEISTDCLGRNLFENLSFIDLSPIGKLLDPRASTGNELNSYFRRFNRFFLLGQKMGWPVEGYLMDCFDEQPDLRHNLADKEIAFDLFRCENLRIPSYIEYQGGHIVGAALLHIVFINLDGIRREVHQARALHDAWISSEAQLLDDPPPRAESDEERLGVWESLGLPARMYYLSFKNLSGGSTARYMEARFESILSHEMQHLVDARRFLPISKNLMGAMIHFMMSGFSPYKVEAWLEERAQLHTLLKGGDPYGTLAEIAGYLEPGAYPAPHERGYRQLMERIIRAVDDDPERFPEFDRSANLVHQLHRLSTEEIAAIARVLADDEGILEPL